MSLEDRRDVLALLEVQVTVQVEEYHITGVFRELDLPAEPVPPGTKILHSHGPPARAG